MTTQRLFTTICLCTLLMLGLSACGTSNTFAEEEVDSLNGDTGWFQLRNEATGKCLDGGAKNWGYGFYQLDADVDDCGEGFKGQLLWRFQARAGVPVLENQVNDLQNNDLCLAGSLHLRDCSFSNSRNDMAWQSVEVVRGTQNPSLIRLAGTDKYLSASGNYDIEFRSLTEGDPSQQWRFVGF